MVISRKYTVTFISQLHELLHRNYYINSIDQIFREIPALDERSQIQDPDNNNSQKLFSTTVPPVWLSSKIFGNPDLDTALSK